MKIILTITASLLLAACNNSAEECSVNSIVERQEPQAQFTGFLRRVVLGTQTAKIVERRLGADFDQTLDEAIKSAVKRNLPSWNSNLQKSWSKLNARELDEVCKAMDRSDRTVLMRYMTKVGGDVQFLNEPLLKKAAVDVLAEIDS